MSVSVAQILTLLVALCIAFWATQYKNDQRKAKEHAERMLLKLQQIVTDEQFYSIPVDGNIEIVQKNINTTNRKISNYINVLKDHGKVLHFYTEITYIETEFSKYKEKVGEHIGDLDYLSKTESEFRRIADNIDSKCESIIILFYK